MNDSIHSNFGRIALLLEEASWSLNQTESRYEPPSSESEQAWEEEDQKFAAELDAICRRFATETGPFRDLPPHQEYFLWCRFRAATEFLRQCDMPAGTSMLQYPNVTDQSLIEWILVEWWRCRGRISALYSYDFTFQPKAQQDVSGNAGHVE